MFLVSCSAFFLAFPVAWNLHPRLIHNKMTRLANSAGRPQLIAFWILPIFSHFHAYLATQPPENQNQIVCVGRYQKWSRLLASNDLKWLREFSQAPQNRHLHRMCTKVVIITSVSNTARISGVLWAKQGERGILREARETRGGKK